MRDTQSKVIFNFSHAAWMIISDFGWHSAWTLYKKLSFEKYGCLLQKSTLKIENWAETWQNQQSDCVASEDSDQPGHPPSLTRVLAVRSMGS